MLFVATIGSCMGRRGILNATRRISRLSDLSPLPASVLSFVASLSIPRILFGAFVHRWTAVRGLHFIGHSWMS